MCGSYVSRRQLEIQSFTVHPEGSDLCCPIIIFSVPHLFLEPQEISRGSSPLLPTVHWSDSLDTGVMHDFPFYCKLFLCKLVEYACLLWFSTPISRMQYSMWDAENVSISAPLVFADQLWQLWDLPRRSLHDIAECTTMTRDTLIYLSTKSIPPGFAVDVVDPKLNVTENRLVGLGDAKSRLNFMQMSCLRFITFISLWSRGLKCRLFDYTLDCLLTLFAGSLQVFSQLPRFCFCPHVCTQIHFRFTL